MKRDKSKWHNRNARKPNEFKRTPIPGLAEHIAQFTNPKERKLQRANFLNALATRLYEVSEKL